MYHINKWAFQWKINFNPDPSTQAQEIIFSWKTKKIPHPSLHFNNSTVSQFPYQKHLGIFLDTQLTFEEHLKVITTKVNKTVRLIRKFRSVLPRPALKTIYKAFVRPYLDYGDVIYDEGYNEAFHKILESIQYNAWLALSRAIRGSSREKLYQELDLESLQRRRWYRKLSLFYKIFKERKPVYFFNLTPTKISNYNTRNTDKITLFRTKHNFFKNYLFSSTVIEWNQLDPNLQSAASLNVFKKNSKFIRPSPNSVFNCHNCKVIKYLTRLRPGLSHFREHKFKHSFQDTVNPFCSYGLDVETNMHFFLYCRLFSNKRCTLLSTVNIFSSLTNTDDITLNDILFFSVVKFL